jgi:hypothetical protein
LFLSISSTVEMNIHDAVANTVTCATINLRAPDDNDSDGVIVLLPLLLSTRSLRQSVRSGKKITSRQSMLNAAPRAQQSGTPTTLAAQELAGATKSTDDADSYFAAQMSAGLDRYKQMLRQRETGTATTSRI